MPDAAARFSTPPSALVDCSTSQPASAMYFRASADCEALKTVVDPYSRAVASSFSNSAPVAPESAATSDIVLENSRPRSTTFCASSLIPEIAARIASAARFASVALNTVKPSSASFAESSTCSRELSSSSAARSASESRCRFSLSSVLSRSICCASWRDSSVVSPSESWSATYLSLSCWSVLSCSDIVRRSLSDSVSVLPIPPASFSAADCAASS